MTTGGALPRTPVERIREPVCAPNPMLGAGHRKYEVNQHAPIEGQFANGRGLDDFSTLASVVCKNFAASRDFYSLRDGTNPQVISTPVSGPPPAAGTACAVAKPDASTFSS